MYGKMKDYLTNTLAEIKEAGLYKEERLIESPQQATILVKGKEVLNFCANNYLGLGDSPRLIEAAKRTYDEKGYGVASVRFICGTQDIHKKLEKKKIPEDIDYDKVKSLRIEAVQKLKEYRPVSIGQASRISGVSPADISVLLVYLGGK